MRITFTKLSDKRHRVTVVRADGSSDSVELDSRSFLRHDLAHLAVEVELGLRSGVWGCVAEGGRLDGTGLDGADMTVAESIAGPMQTMMRLSAGPDEILEVLRRVAPGLATHGLAERLHDRMRSFAGHWAGTPYGGDMLLAWPAGRSGPAPSG